MDYWNTIVKLHFFTLYHKLDGKLIHHIKIFNLKP